MNTQPAIRPELLASKLAAAEHLDEPELAAQLDADPRLIEALWFVQWRSFQPGGLAKFTEDLMAAFPEKLTTRAMLVAGQPRNSRYSLTQCITVWTAELDEGQHGGQAFLESLCVDRGSDPETPPGQRARSESLAEFLAYDFDPKLTVEKVQRGQGCDKARILDGAERFNWDFFQRNAAGYIRAHLPSYLRDLCERKDIGLELGPRWFPSLVSTLLEFMDRHAARERERLAMTAVSEQVFDALAYAWQEKKLVRVNGSSRFGKTESVRTYCAMYPGRYRLVTVPCSNSEGALIRAVAEPFGMSVSFGSRGPELSDKVEFILRHGRLGIIADEAHFLFPIRYGKDTAPARLNWLRTQIVDRGLPCALVSTPQAYEGQRRRFDKATGYNLEQWTGRISLTSDLPDILSREDLLAIARIHFPEVSKPLLEDAVDAAIHATSYTKALQDIAARARWLASKRAAGAVVSQQDLDAAIREVTPEAAAELLGDPSPAARPNKSPATRRGLPRERAADSLRALRPGGHRDTISDPELAPRGRETQVSVPALLTPV